MQRTSKWIAGSFLAVSLVTGYAGSTAIAQGDGDHTQHHASDESRTATDANDYSAAMASIDRHLAHVAQLIENEQLSKVHGAAKPIETIAKTLGKLAYQEDSGIPRGAIREINLTAKQLAAMWAKIDEAGDSGDLAGTKKVYQEMVDLIHTLNKHAEPATGESHTSTPLHGGVIQTVGEFQVEFVVKTHEQAEASEVWTCSMNPHIRASEPGKCPKCSMNLIAAEDGATHIELYIYGNEFEAHPIQALPLTAHLKTPQQEDVITLTLTPAPLEGEGDDVTSRFIALAIPQLAEIAFSAALHIPIEGKTHRVVFDIEPSSHDEDADEDHGHEDKHEDKHEPEEKPDHHGH